MPMRSRRSGSLKASWYKDMRGVATVATTFINLNKKKGFRKNFFISSGNSGNLVKGLCIGECLNKKIMRSRPPTASVISEVHEV